MRLLPLCIPALIILAACAPGATDEAYARYCTPGIGQVYACEGYVKAAYENLGGGARWYDTATGDRMDCPVVAPDSMAPGCKALLERQEAGMECGLVHECGATARLPPGATLCAEEQRQADGCIEVYQPVIGFLQEGTREFSNDCFACIDERVIGWIPAQEGSELCAFCCSDEADGRCAAVTCDCGRSEPAVACEGPRPEICTMEYDPVCGFREDGSTGTYGNACGACGDESVIEYVPGECPAEPAGYTACEEPRPEACTREYRPVCADVDTGVRCVTEPCPSVERETYSNGCVACSDPDVQGYRPGACEECAEDEVAYMSQVGPACVEGYGREEIGFWNRCATAEECAIDQECAYVTRTPAGEALDYEGVPLDAHGMPETALRCVPQDYAAFLLHTSGMKGVDADGDLVEVIA